MSDATTEAEVVEAVAEDSQTAGALDVRNAVSSLNDANSGYFSTLAANTFAERIALAKAINASKPVDTMLGESFDLAHYIVQVVEVADSNNSGEMIEAPRVTFINKDGEAVHGTSKGLLTAVRNLNATVGTPENWEGNTIPIKFVLGGTRPRQYFAVEFL